MNLVKIPKFVKSYTKEQLRSVSTLEQIIKEVGLHNDDRVASHYGVEDKYIISGGMLQQPRQFAEALVFLSNREIKSYLEIGTFYGTGTVFITSYLSVFNPELKTITVDNVRSIDPGTLNLLSQEGINIQQVFGTSDSLKGTVSDLCFIDGDHNYEWVERDYQNVGRFAKLCMFHDIIDGWVADQLSDGGSIQQWAELKEKFPKRRFYEFTYHPTNAKYFGLGIMIKGEK